jgi:hypothetical protein
MSTTNGNLGDGSVSRSEIAKAMVASMQGSSVTKLVGVAAPEPSFASLAVELDALVESSPELRAAVEEAMARNVRQALAFTNAPVASTEAIISMIRDKAIGTKSKGGTVARAFWWGWHVEISHEDLTVALATGDTVNTLVRLIGGSIPSPAQPFIVLAAAFVAAAIGLVRSLDRGRGVYISMSWFAPGIFIPTSV